MIGDIIGWMSLKMKFKTALNLMMQEVEGMDNIDNCPSTDG